MIGIFFTQAIANQRNRKKKIQVLEGPNGLVYDKKKMMDVSFSLYRYLFAFENRGPASLDPNVQSED